MVVAVVEKSVIPCTPLEDLSTILMMTGPLEKSGSSCLDDICSADK